MHGVVQGCIIFPRDDASPSVRTHSDGVHTGREGRELASDPQHPARGVVSKGVRLSFHFHCREMAHEPVEH